MKDTISLRQFLVLLFVGLMSPLIHVTPVVIDRMAPRGGWLAYVGVFVLLGSLVWLIGWAFQRIPKGGMEELLRLGFGEGTGRGLCGLCAAVLLLVTAVALRFYGERYVSTLYPETELGMFFVVLLGLVAWIDSKHFGMLARAGKLFFMGVIPVMVLVILLNLPLVRLYYLWPVWAEELPNIGKGSLSCMGMLSISFGLLFCMKEVRQREDGTMRALHWVAGLCVLATMLGAVTTGVFSSGVTRSLQIPFFTLAKEVRIEGGLERMESFVAAIWMMTDLVLIALLVRAFGIALGCAVGEERRELRDAGVLVLLPLGYLVAGSVFQLEDFYERYVVRGEVVCFYLIPILAVVLGRRKGQL